MNPAIQKIMRKRPFAYSDVFCHPPVEGMAFDANGILKPGIAPGIAAVCKNESNCTLFLAGRHLHYSLGDPATACFCLLFPAAGTSITHGEAGGPRCHCHCLSFLADANAEEEEEEEEDGVC